MSKLRLSHVDARGRARMVDVSAKAVTSREAIASGTITIRADTLRAISEGRLPKGDVLAVARVAGILAAKRCGELIPLCHPLALESAEVTFEIPDVPLSPDARVQLRINAAARITAKTGVEMEALTAVSIAALTIYDMCKAIDETMVIGEVRLLRKTGGTTRPSAKPNT